MTGDHVPEALLIKALDDELSRAEARGVESHLASCDECGGRYQELRQLSTAVEYALAGERLEPSRAARDRLERELDGRELAAAAQPLSPVLRSLSWAVAIAAALAFALMFIPQWKHAVKNPGPVAAPPPSAFEVDGETFVALPYSNPDLPVNASHIVQMQVPVSALADAGIVFEPISNEIGSTDRSVRADVLLGMDGRPVGIHILSSE